MKSNIAVVGITLAAVVFMIYMAATKPRPEINRKGGTTAPDFQLQDLNGNKVRLSDLRGKAVVLNFWATWCPPCREEIPWFVELQNQYRDQGLQIVGVSMDSGSKDAVVRFANEMGINYKLLVGTDDVADLYGGIGSLPTTFYIGRDGKILDYVPGLISHYEVEQNIKAALATHDAPQSATESSAPTKAGAETGVAAKGAQ